MKRIIRLTSLLALATAACDGGEPLDPCSLDLACNVAGVDIAILSVTPVWAPDQDFDAGVGMRVVQPGDEIVADVVVMNRGTVDATQPAELAATMRDHGRVLTILQTIAPLAVGERATYRVRFELATGPRYLQWPASVGAGWQEFRLLHDGYEDADSANDTRAGYDFHVDAPVLEMRLSGLPDTMLVQITYPATLTALNHSQARAFGGGLLIGFCATYADGAPCEIGMTDAVSGVTLGAVAPGATRVQPVSIRLSRDALLAFDQPSSIAVAPCVSDGFGALDCLHPADFDPGSDYDVVALPSLILDCEAPELGDEAQIDLADALCDHRLGTGDVTYAVAWFDADAGDCWRTEFVSASSGNVVVREAATLAGLEHEEAPLDCWRVERSGAQVIVVYPATPGGTPNGTLRLRLIE